MFKLVSGTLQEVRSDFRDYDYKSDRQLKDNRNKMWEYYFSALEHFIVRMLIVTQSRLSHKNTRSISEILQCS